ncbi:Ig-like domain-containing protein [Marinobacter sp. ATCH36]|uniref:Ig-like domain-containing protein n=1 Tax=Marinobacter sp. ATCH36 TaxID=2945106 RepID=UPI00201FD772|nr:Ig-like domain-containing protein [Marinobacter sp. ATCH36]MCL7946111.1 Ig-like domain-containing protein [Marinobacter sp. ATCH36]
MKYNNTLALIPAALLAACGGDDQSINEPATPGSVVYSYPADGQSEVSPKADLVLRFSHALSDDDIESKIRISDGVNEIAFSTEPVDQGQSLKVSPDHKLNSGTEYTIEFSETLEAEGNRVIATPNAVGPDGIQFTTRGEFSGIAELDNLDSRFTVAEMIPSEGNTFRPMNFSTFRLRLTKAVHPQWEDLGGVIELTDSNGDTVPATVLVNGRYVTIDPCIADSPERCGREDDVLNAGEIYTVSIRDLPGINGDTLEEFSEEVTPRETSPTVVLFQEVIDSGLNASANEENARRSRLNGAIINGVTLNSVLQGVAGPSQQIGGLFAELAYAPAFEADEPLPLRVPKGSVLSSSSLDVRVNGTVPVIDPVTGEMQKTGNIKVTMLSDATGYLMPNPYTDDMNAPRHIKLFMDVSMNTEEAQPNASLSQDLLGVELSGIAIVEDGVLTIDAIGMVEPNLLGQEFTDSTIAFRIEAATDSTSALSAAEQRDEELADNTGPQLVSWMPGPEDALPDTRQAMQRPGDPVILNFDEPLDAETIADGIVLDEGGNPLTTDDGSLEAKLDGTALVLNPKGGLKHGVDYTLQIGNALTDLAGNGAMPQDLNFALPDLGDGSVTQRSPLALTTYPGYPCVTTEVDLSAGSHGVCQDAVNTSGGNLDYPAGHAPDELPVTTLPAGRPITVVFSQSMNLNTINAETFIVEKVSDPTATVGNGEIVSGRLEKSNQRVRFYPNTPWEEGTHYRYTLTSSNSATCDPDDICGENGFPLETNLLVDPTAPGGPSMTIYFKGASANQSVFTPLRNLPIRDTNSNYVVDCATLGGTDCLEPFKHADDGQDGFLPSANAARLEINPAREPRVLGSDRSEARVGCQTAGADCPEKKFIYQTYGLNTEVIGPAVDPETGKEGVRVLLYPTLLATTSLEVYLDDGNGLTDVLLSPEDPQVTGPQILRMRYAKDDADCEENCTRNSLIRGIIVEGDDGRPMFKTEADLTLDAPNLALPLGDVLRHNLFSYPFTLKLEGPITFFDDGRMQIEQRNVESPEINVLVSAHPETPFSGDLTCSRKNQCE